MCVCVGGGGGGGGEGYALGGDVPCKCFDSGLCKFADLLVCFPLLIVRLASKRMFFGRSSDSAFHFPKVMCSQPSSDEMTLLTVN